MKDSRSRELSALLDEVRKGLFREDLYWRLNVVAVRLPALRERIEDIPYLVNFYLKKFNRKYRKNLSISTDTLRAITSYKWPGNIRELANMLERQVIMSERDKITAEDLKAELICSGDVTGVSTVSNSKYEPLSKVVEDLEKERIISALKEHNYVQTKAARALGITPRQLGYRIKKYGIKRDSSFRGEDALR